jgi:hypothetical protein
MGSRRLAAAGAVVLIAAAAAGCGGDDGAKAASKQDEAALAQRERARRAGVEQAIHAGKLPPVTLEMFQPDGSVNPNIVDGPEPNGQDVIRTRDHGRSGPPLKWDLDGDGKISAAERHITEEALYQAALPYMASGAQ